ncbi:MAG: ParB/RepB/Spo0J family partition protein [Chloroflexota bacterium]
MSKKGNQTIDLGFLKGEEARVTDLSGLFAQSVTTATDMQQALMVRVDRLLNNPYQPRQEIRDDSVEELAGVIRAQGFQGVLVARPAPGKSGYYQLTAGHRRREAAKRAGLPLLPVVVHDLSEEEMVTLAITENIQREDLTPLEEGKIYLLMSDEMGYTHEQIAREVGRKRGYIENRIRVARAPGDVQKLIQAKPDSIRAVATLIKVKDSGERAEIIELMLAGTLTVEDLPGYIAAKSAHKGQQSAASGSALAALDTEAWAAHHPLSDGHHDGNGEGKAGALAAHHAKAGSEDRSAIRIGNAKLAAVLRYLNTYRDGSLGRQAISEQEQASLANIKLLVDELNTRFGK